MKTLPKIETLLMAILLTATLSACGQSDSTEQPASDPAKEETAREQFNEDLDNLMPPGQGW